MKIYDYPLIDEGATPEKKLQQIKDYLYKLTDELNYNASMTSTTNVFKEVTEAIKNSPANMGGLEIRERKELQQNVMSFISLILENEKTALAQKITALETEIRKLKGEQGNGK